MKRSSKGKRGSAIVEMALVVLPMFMLVVGSLDLGRALWIYHTLNSAVKVGTRFAVVRGERCGQASASCLVSVASMVSTIRQSGIGLDSANLDLTLTSGSGSISCNPVSVCLSNATIWPPSPNNTIGKPVTIAAKYAFRSVLTPLWPGGAFALTARSTEAIQF